MAVLDHVVINRMNRMLIKSLYLNINLISHANISDLIKYLGFKLSFMLFLLKRKKSYYFIALITCTQSVPYRNVKIDFNYFRQNN